MSARRYDEARLRRFNDFAGSDAGGANTNGFPCAIDDCANAAKVGIPAAPGDVVSVTDVVTVRGAFPANLAATCHENSL